MKAYELIYAKYFIAASSLELNAPEVLANVSDWKKLGQQLNIRPEKIHQLERCGGDTEHCREEVVSIWLKEDKEASWQKLCRVLEQMNCIAEVQATKKFIPSCHSPNPEGKLLQISTARVYT